MPELPEVECVRRSLLPLVGSRITGVLVRRADFVTGTPPIQALIGAEIAALDRRGKQIAVLTQGGPIVIVQLGMSGQVLVESAGPRGERNSQTLRTHVHVEWAVEPARRGFTPPPPSFARVLFRDPRRFGGLTTLTSQRDLNERWAALGPDGLVITGDQLAESLAGSRRAIKAALLDQSVVAGVGNIYADEALFAAGISPRTLASRLCRDREAIHRLAAAIRTILHQAIEAGGSTLRDYLDADGRAGEFAQQHLAYGRGGQPCTRCGTILKTATVAQRTTVWCPRCQPSRARHPRQ